jgi:hypothetical protein
MGVGETLLINYVSHLRTDPAFVENIVAAGAQSELKREEHVM